MFKMLKTLIKLSVVIFLCFSAQLYYFFPKEWNDIIRKEKHDKIMTDISKKIFLEDVISGEHPVKVLYLEGERLNDFVVYFHKRGDDISDIHDRFKEIRDETKLSFLLVEYPGYYGTSGSNDFKRINRAVHDFLIERKNDHQNLVVWGSGIGSAFAVELATEVGVDRLILEAGFARYTDNFSDRINVNGIDRNFIVKVIESLLYFDFDNREKYRKILNPDNVSVLLIDGADRWRTVLKNKEAIENAFIDVSFLPYGENDVIDNGRLLNFIKTGRSFKIK